MYIGLDIGTSGTKAALVDREGRTLAFHQVSYGFCNTAQGRRELDAGTVWEAVCTCLKAVGTGADVRTITVSSLGEAIVLTDESGTPVAPGIAGTDARGAEELEELKARLGEEEIVRLTGQNLSVIYSANKMLWLKKHEPEIWERAAKVLTFQDYVIFRLCGEAVIDASMACRTMLMDIATNDWSPFMLEQTGIGKEKLARIVPAGTDAGPVRGALRRELGLQGQLRVIAGTHDHICNAVGCGVVGAGDCANTVGTTEGLTAVLQPEWLSAENIMRYQISKEPFAVPGLYNTVAWNNTSGVLMRWFVNQMMREAQPEKDILAAYAKMEAALPAGPTDLFVLPHFSGAATPYMDVHSKGVILGLTLDTTREEIYKAFMEATCLELALILDCVRNAGLKPARIIVTGGAASDAMMRIKADVMGTRIYTVRNKNAGTLGGAMLGAVADGAFATLAEAASVMVEEPVAYDPDPDRAARYREKMEIYRELYPQTAPLLHRAYGPEQKEGAGEKK